MASAISIPALRAFADRQEVGAPMDRVTLSWLTVLSPKMDARNLITVQSCFGEVTLV